MLIFGPYNAIQYPYVQMVFNLSSLTQDIPRLPGLIPPINGPIIDEKDFDMWYYNYVLNNPEPFKSMMSILLSMYDGYITYVCIGEYIMDSYMSIINESFMKILQQRYGIKYSIVNELGDYDYIQKDGSDFDNNEGLQTFDEDRMEYLQITMEEYISINGTKGLDL